MTLFHDKFYKISIIKFYYSKKNLFCFFYPKLILKKNLGKLLNKLTFQKRHISSLGLARLSQVLAVNLCFCSKFYPMQVYEIIFIIFKKS
jgi:hypothetical protein